MALTDLQDTILGAMKSSGVSKDTAITILLMLREDEHLAMFAEKVIAMEQAGQAIGDTEVCSAMMEVLNETGLYTKNETR